MDKSFEQELARALAELERNEAVARLWRRDHTLWSPEPREIVDRLGWLEPGASHSVLADLVAFAAQVKTDGITDVVLLGMGGSSLGAEVLREVLGSAPGFPRLTVLDSTVPGWVRRVRSGLSLHQTLFLVASKSGTTAEVNALFHYFWSATAVELGESEAGSHFVAITDSGTVLARLGAEHSFRRVFTNRPDIGGRFSVLSLFGLVPAALLGVDLERFVGAATRMAASCGPGRPVADNPGALLGTQLAAAARAGRYKLTLHSSSRLVSFGLWAEQLIAESTGKDGRGILPVVGEARVAPTAYRGDRLFVALQLEQPAEETLKTACAELASAGHPVIELFLDSPAELGGEFFRWEFATAVAAHLLAIHPFDQPNVEESKSQTKRLLAEFRDRGRVPAVEAEASLGALLAAPQPPEYVALLGYLDADDALEREIALLRRRLLQEQRLATTFGYGPRYLHSTGQFHKGGPSGGLHVLLIARGNDDLPIPGEPYGFGTLARAQAAGDLLALRSRNRTCLRIDLGDDPAAGLARLTASLAGP